MDLNNTTSLIGNMFVHDIFGSVVIAAIFLILLFIFMAWKTKISILDIVIVCIIPLIIILAFSGYIPAWIGGVVIMIAAIIAAIGLFKVLAGDY